MDKQIFISFSSKDQTKADQIVDFLEKNSCKCFISSRDLIAGQEYASQLIDNIEGSNAVVLLLSKASNESPHVLREVECAVSKKVPIIVYTLEEVSLSKSLNYYLMTHQWVQTGSDQKARLLAGISNICNGSEIPFAITSEDTAVSKSKFKIPTAAIIAVCAVLCIGIIILIVTLAGKSSDNPEETNPPVTMASGSGVTMTSDASGNTASDAGSDAGSNTSVVSGSTDAASDTGSDSRIADLKPGQVVTFGNYLESPIEWIILKADDDAYTLVSKYILSMKCFDAAEGGDYGLYEGVDYFSYENHIITDPSLTVKVRGNNDWSKSNLRTWLNSDKGVVIYEDQGPVIKAVYANPYDHEAGFLKGFSDAEKNAMKAVTITTPVNSLNEEAVNGRITTTDYVYLLSSDELSYFADIDMHIYTKPTEEAISQDKNNEGYNSFLYYYDSDYYYYWLRDCNPDDYTNLAYFAVTEIEAGMQYISGSVGACTYGVRPVITVKKAFFTE